MWPRLQINTDEDRFFAGLLLFIISSFYLIFCIYITVTTNNGVAVAFLISSGFLFIFSGIYTIHISLKIRTSSIETNSNNEFAFPPLSDLNSDLNSDDEIVTDGYV